MWEDVFTIVSNLGFLFPFALAVHYGYVLVAFDLMAQMLFSMGYHTCNSYSGACLGLSPLVWRYGDFFWAQYMIFRTALILIHFPNRWVRPALMLTAGGVLFMVQRWVGESTWLQLGVAFVAFGGLLIYWIIYALNAHAQGKKSLLPPYRWLFVWLGFALSALACSLYVTEMLNHRLYWAIHSVWHMDAALGQFFILLAWPPNVGPRQFESQSFLARLIEKRNTTSPFNAPIVIHHLHTKKGGGLVHRTPPSRV